MIILKVTKNQGFTLSLEDTVFEKSEGEEGWGGAGNVPSSFLRVKHFTDTSSYIFLYYQKLGKAIFRSTSQ